MGAQTYRATRVRRAMPSPVSSGAAVGQTVAVCWTRSGNTVTFMFAASGGARCVWNKTTAPVGGWLTAADYPVVGPVACGELLVWNVGLDDAALGALARGPPSNRGRRRRWQCVSDGPVGRGAARRRGGGHRRNPADPAAGPGVRLGHRDSVHDAERKRRTPHRRRAVARRVATVGGRRRDGIQSKPLLGVLDDHRGWVKQRPGAVCVARSVRPGAAHPPWRARPSTAVLTTVNGRRGVKLTQAALVLFGDGGCPVFRARRRTGRSAPFPVGIQRDRVRRLPLVRGPRQ